MQTSISFRAMLGCAALTACILLSGCQTGGGAGDGAGASSAKAVRINAGAKAQNVDKDGNVWLPDTGFVGGDIVDRGNITIVNTTNPGIYRTEHYGMSAFSCAVPNGKYTVKLHFAETFDGVTAKGERVFSVDVEGQVIKDLDVFAEAGGLNKALVKTVTATVADGKLDIKFITKTQNPEINGIEIIPQ